MLRAFFGLIGLLFLYPKIKNFLLFFYNLIFGPKRDLLRIYGKNSYALVTGGSEGIGEALAAEFASRGFNLVLVSRSMEKLQKAKDAILAKFPQCKVIVASFDFNNIDKPENFDLEKAFGLNLSTLDISIVVNNVGIGRTGLFYDGNEEDIKKMIRVNCVSTVLVTRYFISLFQKRKQRSAFLNLSSLSAIKSLPLYDTYGASKAFDYQFTESIGNFYSNIDLYNFMPGWVSTRLTNFKKEVFATISAPESARAAVNNFGSYRYVFAGHWSHELMAFILNAIPERVQAFIIMRNKEKYIKKQND